MRRILPPNSSSSFEVSAIFGMVILMAFVAMLGICGIASGNFINTFVVTTISALLVRYYFQSPVFVSLLW